MALVMQIKFACVESNRVLAWNLFNSYAKDFVWLVAGDKNVSSKILQSAAAAVEIFNSNATASDVGVECMADIISMPSEPRCRWSYMADIDAICNQFPHGSWDIMLEALGGGWVLQYMAVIPMSPGIVDAHITIPAAADAAIARRRRRTTRHIGNVCRPVALHSH